MKLKNTKVLLKEIKDENPLALNNVDHYEVYDTAEGVTEISKGDNVLYEEGRKVLIKGEEYILTDEENIWLIL